MLHEQGNPEPDLATVLERARQASGGSMNDKQQQQVQELWDILFMDPRRAVETREQFSIDENNLRLDVLASLAQWSAVPGENDIKVKRLSLLSSLANRVEEFLSHGDSMEKQLKHERSWTLLEEILGDMKGVSKGGACMGCRGAAKRHEEGSCSP